VRARLAGCACVRPLSFTVRGHMGSAYESLEAYHRSGRPLSCEIGVERWLCEFWPLAEVEQQNLAYQVPTYAPGYFGFASNLGGEMYAISPSGTIVSMPFVGMSPREALHIADSWETFEKILAVPSNNRWRGP
jgi:hypothetical protein